MENYTKLVQKIVMMSLCEVCKRIILSMYHYFRESFAIIIIIILVHKLCYFYWKCLFTYYSTLWNFLCAYLFLLWNRLLVFIIRALRIDNELSIAFMPMKSCRRFCHNFFFFFFGSLGVRFDHPRQKWKHACRSNKHLYMGLILIYC